MYTSSFFSPIAIPQRQKNLGSTRKKKVIVIAGPTAVGKSRLSLMLAKVLGGEIISADSIQVYRGMDIGTAKIKPEERGNIRHHLIDSRDLDESFNVVDFYNEAIQAFREIFARDHVPVIVGGTGFYIHSLLYGPPQGPPANQEIREKLEKKMDANGGPLALYEELKSFDPEYASTITFHDRQKIIRALEIITLTKQKVSSFEKSSTAREDHDFRCWFIYAPKEVLYSKIEKRCDQMIQEGLLEEVRKLEGLGLKKNSSASQAIGYRQCLDFFETHQSADDWDVFLKEFKQASRRYAKRQFTWFRKETMFRWLNIETLGIDSVLETILQDYEFS